MIKCILVLSCLIIVTSGQYDIADWSYMEILDVLGKATEIRDGDVHESDVNLYLYTRNNPNEGIWLEHHKNYNLKTRKGTKVIIHGFLENYQVTWMRRMREELLKLGDFNVIQVDWKRVANSFYIFVAKNCYIVGDIIGTALVEHKIPASKLHIIGFSLGSHIAAFTSRKIRKLTNEQVDRISGLDPAGPYFRMGYVAEDDRLNPGAAKVVDVLHTDGGFLGYILPIGTFDIYANRGTRKQPGCKDSEPTLDKRQFLINFSCSHYRLHAYFTQSLLKSNITCKLCEGFDSMYTETCRDDQNITIVNQNITGEMSGICAFSTSDAEPYF